MSITRERLLEIIVTGPEASGAEQNELARMALAAMDSEPVAYIFKHPAGRLFWALTDESNKGQSDVMPVYAAPQPAVESDFIPKNLDKALGVLGMAIPESREEFNFQTERWIQRLIDRVIRYADEFQGQPALVVPEDVRQALSQMDDEIIAEMDAEESAYRAARLAAAPRLPGSDPATVPDKWIPVSERMPEPGILVLVYTPPQPDDYPGDVRIGFDYIDPDGDDPTYWFNHGENYEHFYCVACDGMTGPSEKAPYTHWIPLPAAPQEVNHG